jgi:membrane fusion protein (multidrug efflux system)
MTRGSWIGSTLLLLTILGVGSGLARWKHNSIEASEAANARQPEPMEAIAVAVAHARDYARTTTSIGTVVALRSITLRNEIAGTVKQVELKPGETVDEGVLLVALDVSVEEAELKAQQAQASLAETWLGRVQRASQTHGASDSDVDKARAERDVALAQVARTEAIIARKTIRAPFRAHMGISDIHPGQYLKEGTELTTLQGVDAAVHVDFTVAQTVALGLAQGMNVDVFATADATPLPAKIVAIDSRVDPVTRNTTVRAEIKDVPRLPTPGASVRVRVPVGAPHPAVVIPVSALRRGPTGDHVFVIAPDAAGKERAHQKTVQGGAMLADEIVVEEGLAVGDRVAASGSFKLHEGELVAIVDDAAAVPSGAAASSNGAGAPEKK